jgi:hypothetical protein
LNAQLFINLWMKKVFISRMVVNFGMGHCTKNIRTVLDNPHFGKIYET